MPNMEDLIDDDFGDLYADVEIQAISVINSTSNFTKLYTEPEIQENEDTNNNNTKQVNPNKKEGNFMSASKQLPSVGENLGSLEADGSDSDDDLNILLNDDECKGFPVTTTRNGNGGGGGGYEKDEEGDGDGFVGVKNGFNMAANWHGGESGNGGNGEKGGYNSQYPQHKHVRSYGSSFPSNKKGNESVGLASSSSKFVRGDWEDNGCKQHKVSNSGLVANICATSNSVASHGGYGFSLPWYRSILDVNIDAFEDKRWRNPGVDISDFFNFGFNEDSWRQYCVSLEQFRQRSYVHNMIPIHRSSKLTQAYEIGFEHNGVGQGAIAKDITQGGSSSKPADRGDRQLGLPKGRAIQVEDSTGERQSTMDFRGPCACDSDVVIQINVQDSNENSSVSGEEELDHIDSAGREASKGRDLKVDDMRDTNYSSCASGDELSAESPEENIRCPKPIVEPNQMSLDPDNHENDPISGADRHHHQKANAQTSNAIAEAMEIVEKGEEEICKNTCRMDQCLFETELSLGDQSYLSPTLSFSGSDSEASIDNCCGVPEESPCPLRRHSSGTELRESVASDHRSPKSNGVVRKLSNIRNCSRNRNLIQEGQNHQTGRPRRGAEQRIHFDNDYDASPISRNQSSIDCSRWIERLHDFDYYNREDFLYYRQRDHACGGGERFVDNHVQAVYTKHSHKKYHRSFRNELKSKERTNRNEKHHFLERSMRLDNQDDMHRHWDKHGSMVPLAYKSRRLVSKYENFKEKDLHWRGDKIQFEKRTSHDRCLLHHKDADDVIQEKYGRFVSFGNRKRETLDEKHARHGPFIGREMNLFGRRARCGDNLLVDLDSSWCMEMEDEYQDLGHQHLSFRSHRESYADNDGSWRNMMSPRGDLFDSRLTERYVRHGRKMCDWEGRGSGWVGSYNDAANNKDGIIYPDDEVHVGRRRYGWRSRVAHHAQDESLLRRNDEFYAERTACSYGVTSRHERVHAKFRSANGGMVVDDMQLECHRYKIIREQRSANVVNRNHNRMHRGNHEQMAGRCSDSVDFGEGKSSGRCSNSGSLMPNGKVENMDPKFAKEKTMLKDFKASWTGKAMETGIPIVEGNQDNEKWLDKYPVTEHNKDLDIEDGQIIIEEPNIEGTLVMKLVSEGAASTPNVKKIPFHRTNASSGNETTGAYDDQWILDTLARMEKRRERFKDPIALQKEPDKTPGL